MAQPRDRLHTIDGRLFQAATWRRYAQCWDGLPNTFGYTREWMEKVFRKSRADCIRRARVNLYLARRLNRKPLDHVTGTQNHETA